MTAERFKPGPAMRCAETAHDTATALTYVQASQPTLILLDLSIADGGAETLVEACRRMAGTSAPIVVVSAQTNVAQQAVTLGANGSISKPFDLSELIEMVQMALATREEPADAVAQAAPCVGRCS